MQTLHSSDVRREWSSVMDSVIREKPVFIQRTRDCMMLSTTELISQLVANVMFAADAYPEQDGGITLSLRDMDIAVHADSLDAAKTELVHAITEYAEEYYQNFAQYFASPNRRAHLPYIIKALTAGTPKELEDAIVCQAGEI